MQKLLISIMLIMLAMSCQKIHDGVIDPIDEYFYTESFSMQDTLSLVQGNSGYPVSIKLNRTGIENLFVNVYNSKKTELLVENTALLDNGNLALNADQMKNDRVYSALINFPSSIKAGNYHLEIIRKEIYKNDLIAFADFYLKTGAANVSPVIKNLVFPDPIVLDQKFIITIKVEDQNGLKDIERVWFLSIRPDGTQSVPAGFTMSDLGDEAQSGDKTANDGIYSYPITITSSAMKGDWRLEFYAKDKSGAQSNAIIKTFKVN